MSSTTSATYAVWRVLTARMKALAWPPGPNGELPAVWFGDPSQPNPNEDGVSATSHDDSVCVGGIVETPDVDWGPIGQLAREEAWRTPIYVKCARQGMTAIEAAARCEALTAAIEQNIRRIQAGAQSGTDQPAEFADYYVWNVAVERTQALVAVSDGGYVAVAEVVIGCLFRINKPLP